MLDMGFLPDVRRILRALPTSRQTLLFSATMPREIERLAKDTLRKPEVIDIGQRATPVDTVRQVLYLVEVEQKRDLLNHLLQSSNMRHVLVFTRTKIRADRLAKHLAKTDRRVAALHGDKTQRTRTQTLDRFRNGQVDVLIATDIASRGLDVEGISHVVNFDVPNSPEDYVHRIGRTARAEAKGEAITFASSDEIDAVRAIESLLGEEIPRKVIRGFEPTSFTVRRFEKPAASRAARIASGSIRHFRPRGRRRKSA
jgi:ATP-dependent RNA helicase RhlE